MTEHPVNEMVDLLYRFGVDFAFPERRLDKAKALHEAGVKPEDAEIVFTFAERSSASPDKVPGLIVLLCRKPADITRMAREMADYVACRHERLEAAKDAKPEEHDHGRSLRTVYADPKEREWEYDSQCLSVYARVRGDRHSHEQVAADLSLPLADVPAMFERGKALRLGGGSVDDPVPLRAVSDDPAEIKERIERFKRDMAARRLA